MRTGGGVQIYPGVQCLRTRTESSTLILYPSSHSQHYVYRQAKPIRIVLIVMRALQLFPCFAPYHCHSLELSAV
ncbi:hypothetical protein Y1Q_0006154 [Alligator mississippiensis]|uniref:Uncharacterized protein n=1 Tax=Alligator mississippiensis TaxID=8496 RepID=A0A151NWM3_ALLMI|nr:hypothetical protein Y1Q_0006154 [Alligator mississippiensis]